MLQAIQAWDEAALVFIREHIVIDKLTPLVTFITNLDEMGAVWIAIAIVLLLFKRTRVAGIDMILALAVTFVLNDFVFKPLVLRPRPWVAIEGFASLIKHPSGTSFPSGHSVTSFACATAMTRDLGKKAGWIFILAALIALSRPYLGVHFITDILAGALIGTLGAALVVWVRRKVLPLEKRWNHE